MFFPIDKMGSFGRITERLRERRSRVLKQVSTEKDFKNLKKVLDNLGNKW